MGQQNEFVNWILFAVKRQAEREEVNAINFNKNNYVADFVKMTSVRSRDALFVQLDSLRFWQNEISFN